MSVSRNRRRPHDIDAVVRGLIDTWNKGDAERFAKRFAPRADYITGEGRRIQGRDAIAELVRQGRPGLAIDLVGDPRVECRGSVATARFGWAIAGQGGDARRGSITCKLVRNGAHWLIQRLQNHEADRVRLMRFPSAVERDPAIDAWFDSRGALGAIGRPWYERMRQCGDDVRELLHDGHPTACAGDAAFGYVNAFTVHVNVGFFLGAHLADPAGLLEGTGKNMRHVKLRPGSEIDSEALGDLIRAAYSRVKAFRGQRNA